MFDQCKICQKPADGNHFGAISCRACSAFFRRSIVDRNSEKFECSHGDYNCQLKNMGKFFCKKCRLQKCYEMGMNPKYFQHGRDKIKTPYHHPKVIIPESISTFIGRPAQFIHCVPSSNIQEKVFIDVTFLVEQAAEVFKNHPKRLDDKVNTTILERMAEVRQVEDSTKYSEVAVLDKQFFLFYWEKDLLKTARWLSSFDGFLELPEVVRLQIVMATWHLRSRLDRLIMTASHRTKQKIRENEFMVSESELFDLRTCKLELSWCTQYSLEQIAFFVETSDDWVHNQIVRNLENLNPSDIEISFMMLQLCFHYAGKRFQGDILETMEHFLDVISNELHEYYKRKEVVNYSERIGKIMKINNMIQKVIFEKRWKAELAEKFDIFNLKFSHPEMFTDCC